MKKLCRHKCKSGQLCRANAIVSSGYCFFHDPDRAAERLAARRAGGLRNKAASLPLDAPDRDLKNAQDVVTLLGLTLNQVRTGKIDPKIANSVGYISGILLKALEVETLERRVTALEIATGNHLQSNRESETETFDFITRPAHDQPETIDEN